MLNKYIFTLAVSFFAVQAPLTMESEAATSVPFQRYINSTCPSAPGDCTINFPLVANGKRMDIVSASCYSRFTGSSAATDVAALQLLVIAPPSRIVNAVTLKNDLVDSTSTYTAYASNDQFYAFAGPNTQFQAFMRFTKGTLEQFACHISGQVITP